MNLILSVLFFISIQSDAQTVKRIKAIAFNKQNVEKIYIAPGLASLLSFNCEIDEFVSGNKNDVRIEYLNKTRKQINVTLSNTASNPTNLMIKCGGKDDPFVFDVIPNKKNHQDYLKINLSYGQIEQENTLPVDELSKLKKKPAPKLILIAGPKKKNDFRSSDNTNADRFKSSKEDEK